MKSIIDYLILHCLLMLERGDGMSYVARSWEKYNKMSEDEKAEVDELRKKLYEKFGVDEE